MKWLWIMICVLGGVLLETGLSAYGVAVPFTALVVFYLSAVFGWRTTVIVALPAAALLEITYGRQLGSTVAVVLAAMGAATLWRREGNCRVMLVQMVPGAVLGMATALLLLVNESLLVEVLSFDLLRHDSWVALQIIVGAALLMPLTCSWLDRLARDLHLPCYRPSPQSQQAGQQAHVS